VYKIAKVVVFIPAYNEEESIGRIITEINEIYKDSISKGFEVEVIVIDDGSIDNTVRVAREAGAKTVIMHPYNRGLGAATRTGMERAFEMGADIAVKIDADFQHDPIDIEKVIRPILEDRADVVFGSRFLGKINYRMPLYRRVGNAFFSYLTSKLTGLRVTDGQTGLMAFSKRYLSDFEIISDYNETQQLIIDSWSRHMRIVEVPVVFHERKTGRSFISLKYPLKVLPTLLRLLVHTNPLKVFIPLGIGFILAGICLGLFLIYAYYHGMEIIFEDATVAILVVVGIQIITFGFLADLMSKNR
jgi:glycosyltransferase involved in cell wall biosynthesis